MKQVIIGEALVSSGVFRSQEHAEKHPDFRHLLRHANVTTRNGLLVLTARGLHEPILDANNVPVYYTSGRVTTKGIKHYGQGTYTAKIKCRLVKGAGPGWWSSAPVWPDEIEHDYVEYNYQGNPSKTSSGLIGPNKGNIDNELWNLENPEAWHVCTWEHTDTYVRVLVDGIERFKRTKQQVSDAVKAQWDTKRFLLLCLQVRDWNGVPQKHEYMNNADPIETLIEYVEIDEKVTQVEVPSLPGNPMPEQGEDMNITLLDTKKVHRTNKDPEYHLTWALDGTPSSDVKLVIDGPGWGEIKFLTTGLAHIYVPQTWTKFSYWLEGPDFLGEKHTHFFSEPVDTANPTPIEELRATANIMRSQAAILDQIIDKL